jgi:hypothetical protein
MTELIVMDAVMFICNQTEARELWRTEPEKRGYIFLDVEATRILNLDNDKLAEVLRMKRESPSTRITADLVEAL